MNRTAEAYAQLELQAQFALDMYKTAITALEQGRLEATRTLKKFLCCSSPICLRRPQSLAAFTPPPSGW